MHTLAESAAIPIEASSSLGSRYTIGSSTNVLYEASGGSDDWTKGAFGVELSYCWELPGGGMYFRKHPGLILTIVYLGNFGFNPPVTMIRPIVEETFEGFAVFGEYIDTLYGRR